MIHMPVPASPGVQAQARKTERFLSQCRSNLRLMIRSKVIGTPEIVRTKSQILHSLDSKNLIYPPRINELMELDLDSRKEVLGLFDDSPQPTDNEIKFEAMSERIAHNARKTSWSWRIGQEAELLDLFGWYPFFVTLTLDPSKVWAELGLTRPQFWKCRKGNYFQKYLKRLAAISAQSMGCQAPHKSGVPQSEFLRYVAVLEHGESREHDHLHMLVWLRSIPDEWARCPNRRYQNPANRIYNRCLGMESLWPWDNGRNSPCLYWRHQNSIWQRKHNFVTPTSKGKPMTLRPTKAAGSYLTKYILKGDKTWNHRVKATRGLGLTMLRDLMWRLPKKTLEALTWRAPTFHLSTSLLMIHSVPHVLLRQVAKSLLFCRLYEHDLLDYPEELRKNSEGFKQMLKSVRNGAEPHKMPLSQLYDWVSSHLPVPEGYCDQRLIRAHKTLAALSPPHPTRNIQTIGANRI